MTTIDATARIEPGARIGTDVEIGPYCVIGRDAVLGDGCRLEAHVVVSGNTTIGARTVVHPFATLGGAPQAIVYRGEPTRLEIGSDCTIREYVSMSRGTVQDGGLTKVGDRGYFMANSHVAHDCKVGNDCVFANSATLAGHCVIGDNVLLSGLVALHQFSRIGAGAMVAGGAIIRGDVIPLELAAGARARLHGINVVGMRRRGYAAASIRAVRSAYRMIFFGSGSLAERVEAAAVAHGHEPAVAEIIAFLKAARRRPLCQPRGRSGDDRSAID